MDARQRPDPIRRVQPALVLAMTLMVLCALAGCGGGEGGDAAAVPQRDAAARPRSPLSSPPAAATGTDVGLTPLPSPQQVLAALPIGRPDPFAPVVAPAQTAGPAPEGLRLTGVLRSRFGPQAFLQLAPGQGGAVCLGPRGLCAGSGLPALLPPGWSVVSIDVANGRLLLNQGGPRRLLSL